MLNAMPCGVGATRPCSPQHFGPGADCRHLESLSPRNRTLSLAVPVSVGLGREQTVQAVGLPISGTDTEYPDESERRGWGRLTQTPAQMPLVFSGASAPSARAKRWEEPESLRTGERRHTTCLSAA